MKVLQVCAFAAPYEGNFTKLLKILRKELVSKGDDMIFAFPLTAKGTPWIDELEELTHVYFLPLARAYLLPKTYRILRQIYIDHPDIKIVHSHFELYDIPVVKTAPLNVKVFWHLHDSIESYNDLKNKILFKLQYGMFHGKANILSVSKVHAAYVGNLGFPEKNIFHIPNGIDLERIKQVDLTQHKEYDFLLFGWEYYRKGVDLCVEAVNMLGKNIVVAIVGKEGIVETIKKNFGEIPESIRIIEPVSDVNKLYERTKCFLHISRFEGHSYALLEAAYAGLPIICSNIEANAFAEEFPSVLMVKSGDSKEVSLAMDKQKLARNLLVDVEQTRQIISEKYSVACWIRQIMEIYFD